MESSGSNRRASARIAALLAVAAILALPQQSQAQGGGKALAIGKADSPALRALGSSRQKVDGREIAKAARAASQGADADSKREDALKRVAERLKDVSVVMADLSEITPTDDDRLLVDAARRGGIPLALEKVTADKMARFLGMGTDADLVVVESRGQGSEMSFNVFGGEPPSFEDQELPPIARKRAADDIPPGGKEPTKEEQKAPITDEVGPMGKTRVDALPSAARAAEKIVNEKPFSKGGRNQSLITNNCPTGNTACRESQVYWNPWTWHPEGVSENHILHPGFSFGLYRLGEDVLLVFRFQGDIGTNMTWNDSKNRGYFLESYRLYANVTSMPSQWSFDHMAPGNTNSTANLASTTSWGVSGSVGSDMTGPKAAVSGNYGLSETFNTDISDFSVARLRPSAESVLWEYKMSASSGGEYKEPGDLAYWDFLELKYYDVPTIARYGTDLVAEATFVGPKGPTDCSETINLDTNVKENVVRLWFDTSDILHPLVKGWRTWLDWPHNWAFCTNWP